MKPATSIATIALPRCSLLLAVGLAAAGCSADEEELATTEDPLLFLELNCRTLNAHASYLQSKGFNLGTAYPERALPDGGSVRQYANAVLYWSPSTCAREVHGPIFGRYFWMGEQASEVGYPTSDTFPLTSSVSARSLFQRGAIYWKPELGARVVKGPVYDKYVSLGRDHDG